MDPRRSPARCAAVLLGVAAQVPAPMTKAESAGRHAEHLEVATTSAGREALRRGAEEAWRGSTAVAWGDAPYGTRFRAAATTTGLWLRFDADDASPWHTLTERDDPLWNEEVVEIFIDPDGDRRNYVEIEVSPANVVCDLLMARGDPDKRGDLAWDFDGLESWVHRWQGDEAGWTAIALLPWQGFAAVPDTRIALPPRPGDRWHVNLFRIKRPHGPQEPDRGVILSAWSPVPGDSFHVPEVFREMVFVE